MPDEKADAEDFQRIPSARAIARLMTVSRDRLSKSETVTVAALEAGVPAMKTAGDDWLKISGQAAEREGLFPEPAAKQKAP